MCSSCGEQAKSGLPVERSGAYIAALLYGLGGAVAGFILYALVTIVTGWEIGFVSLAVGFLVGAAMKKGAGGYGGRKYQITAALLTYAAVSLAAIPIYLYLGHGKEMSTPGQPVATFLTYALIGFASPVLGLIASPGSGILGLVILFVGIRYAWQATAAHMATVDGPYDTGVKAASASAGAAAGS